MAHLYSKHNVDQKTLGASPPNAFEFGFSLESLISDDIYMPEVMNRNESSM